MILVSPCLALIEVTVLDILKVSKMFYTMLYSAHVQGGNEYGIGMMLEGESENQMHLNLKSDSCWQSCMMERRWEFFFWQTM